MTQFTSLRGLTRLRVGGLGGAAADPASQTGDLASPFKRGGGSEAQGDASDKNTN
jgi:hypothetical protein